MKINKENYTELLISYMENELPDQDKREVEKLIRSNEEVAREYEILKLTRIKPDEGITFPSRQLLFREEQEEKITDRIISLTVVKRFAAIAAAAAFIGFAILVFLKSPDRPSADHSTVAMASNGKDKTAAQGTGDLSTQGSEPGKHENKTTGKSSRSNTKNRTNRKEDKKQSENPAKHQEQKHPTILLVDQPSGKVLAYINAPYQKIQNPAENSIFTGQPVQHLKMPESTEHPVEKIDNPDYKSTLASVMDLLKKVSLKKRNINNETWYALSIETNNIKIDKTFKSLNER